MPDVRPPMDSPWYALLTLYSADTVVDSDKIKHKNRRCWNRLVFTLSDSATREKIICLDGIPLPITPFNEAELAEIHAAFRTRCGGRYDPPLKIEEFNLTNIHHTGVDFSLEGYIFPAPLILSDSTVNSGKFLLRNCVFLSHFVMNRSSFTCGIQIFDCDFRSGFKMEQCSFQNDFDIKRSTFHNFLSLSGSEFSRNTYFIESNFWQSFNGMNCRFKGKTEIRDCEFHRRPPDFRGSSLHEATEFTGVKWPPTPSTGGASVIQKHIFAYERLKLEMETKKKHADELFFFVKEMRCRSSLMKRSFPDNIFMTFYSASSDFGTSFSKPLTFLAISNALFSLYIYSQRPKTAFIDILTIIISSVLSFSPFSRDIMTSYAQIFSEGHLKSLLIINSTMSAISLFLIILAFRNRFRLK